MCTSSSSPSSYIFPSSISYTSSPLYSYFLARVRQPVVVVVVAAAAAAVVAAAVAAARTTTSIRLLQVIIPLLLPSCYVRSASRLLARF
jgi:hypothetical protein